jgi:hypothetical protein
MLMLSMFSCESVKTRVARLKNSRATWNLLVFLLGMIVNEVLEFGIREIQLGALIKREDG